ncbi:hypothetical protein Droror1_Dr00027784 [Drosera rotundifolia]
MVHEGRRRGVMRLRYEEKERMGTRAGNQVREREKGNWAAKGMGCERDDCGGEEEGNGFNEKETGSREGNGSRRRTPAVTADSAATADSTATVESDGDDGLGSRGRLGGGSGLVAAAALESVVWL